MSVYYNEFEPFAAAWLKELMADGLIAPGVVDGRSIEEVQASDLKGFTQCHFFAGIGGWSYAARLAGWGDDRPMWTGSCPCQPFSAAGKRQGEADKRHLWPHLRRLIAECSPPVVFGEQVASADGRVWLAGVRTDLEALAYHVGAADLCAAGVSAPHIRQRLYWVGFANGAGSQPGNWPVPTARHGHTADPANRQPPDGMADAERERLRGERPAAASGAQSGVQGQDGERKRLRADVGPASLPHGVGDADSYQRHWWSGPVQMGRNGIEGEIERGGRKYRAQWRVGPGIPIVAHGIPNRVGALRGAGNAIVPQLAAEFIQAADEAAIAST